ncbi:MAG: nitrophenyl compound nitroreductase subunit ArsF family protein [Candidatus Aminicenantales bacterium]
MKLKTIITVVLLLFVAASVVYLVVKESGGQMDSTTGKATAPAGGPAPASVSPNSAPQAEPAAQPAPAEKLQPAPPSAPQDKAAGSDNRVIAYYFHAYVRCITCRTIEAYSGEAVQSFFADALKSGRLEWRVINVEEPGNEHFIQDFQLVTRSVVLELMEKGARKRWKNLQLVWQLVHDEKAFKEYIRDETKSFLATAPQ